MQIATKMAITAVLTAATTTTVITTVAFFPLPVGTASIFVRRSLDEKRAAFCPKVA